MKKTFFKRAISSIVALVMVLAMIPAGVITISAADYDVSADGNTITINNAAGWNAIAEHEDNATYATKNIVLGDDIAFGETAAKTLFSSFSGTFNGNGKTVSGTALEGINLITDDLGDGTIDGNVGSDGKSNMTITGFAVSDTATNECGMVAGAVVGVATVKNITVSNCTIETKSNSAALIGNIKTTAVVDVTVYNCNVTNTTVTCVSQSGLIVGAGENGNVTIEKCSVTDSTVSASTSNANAAGVAAIFGKINAGIDKTIIKDCTTKDVVVATAKAASWANGIGIVVGQAGAYNNGTYTANNGTVFSITGCEIDGTVTSTVAVFSGGLVGLVCVGESVTTIISGNTVNAEVSATTFAGGLVGHIKNSAQINDNTVTATVATSSTTVENYAGGLVGHIGGSVTANGNKASGSVTAAGKSSIVGYAAGGFAYVAGSATINDTVINANITAYNASAGGLVGQLAGDNINVDGAKVSGTVYDKSTGGGSAKLGGILGNATAATGTNTIKNCYVDANIFSSAKWGKVGGISGGWTTADTDVTLNITNCYVGGNIAAYCDSSNINGGAGIIFEVVSTTTDINLSGVVVAANIAQTYYDHSNSSIVESGANTTISTKGNVAIKTLKKVDNVTSSVTYTDCYTTVKNTTNFENVTSEDATLFLRFDENGFVSGIKDHVTAKYYQVSNIITVEGQDCYMVRFIGGSLIENFKYATMTIVATYELDGKTYTNTFVQECDAYDKLTGYTGDDGYSANEITEYIAADYGYSNFVATTITGVPTYATQFSITVDVVDTDNNTYQGTFSGSVDLTRAQ